MLLADDADVLISDKSWESLIKCAYLERQSIFRSP